jgi:hypothetical protein
MRPPLVHFEVAADTGVAQQQEDDDRHCRQHNQDIDIHQPSA